MSRNRHDPDRAPPERPDTDPDAERFGELLQQPGESEAEPDAADEQSAATASPLADEVADLGSELADAEPDDSLNADTSPPDATTDDGEDLTGLYQPDGEDVELGEIVDWRFTDGTEEWVVLQTKDEQVQRKAATPEETVQDWVALIKAGAADFGDVEARPYQDWSDDEMQERVDAELRGGL
jgi:hypothetical protein